MSDNSSQLLSSLRVLELGHFVAAPFCTRLLADLGADVIKVEPLTGDPVRNWGEMVNGRSLWWSLHGRNKRSITLDLKSEKGRDILRQIVPHCDVVVENFRPGQLARMGLGPELLRSIRPDIIIAQISGYGQTGPGRDRAAFGVIGEAVGGLRHLTNQPPGTSDQPPVRVGVSIGDSLAGLYAAFGIMAALWQRDRLKGDGKSRTIDVALTESVLSMMEGMLPEYSALGKIKQPTGGGIATAAPSNAYPTRDNQWVLIAANSEPLFKGLMQLMDRPDLIGAPDYCGNIERVRNAGQLDELIGAWSRQFDAEQLLHMLDTAGIPSSKVYTAADCASDTQYLARNMVQEVNDPHFGKILHTGIVPHIPESPGAVRWPGPDLGQHNQEILHELLGYSNKEIQALADEGIL